MKKIEYIVFESSQVSYGYSWSFILFTSNIQKQKQANSVAWAHYQTISTERRHLLAKLLSTFVDRECHVVSVTDRSAFKTGATTFSSKWLLTNEADWTLLQTQYFSENRKSNPDLWICSQEL
jgi:hypothetical protein